MRCIRSFAAALVVALLAPAAAWAAEPVIFDLSGTWELTGSGGLAEGMTAPPLSAKVPGNIHTDLLAAGKIPDPYFGDNENKLQWISDSTWTYAREFAVSPELMGRKKLLLRCEGLDTVATIRINGKKVADTDNMFRTWEFDAKPFVRAGSNRIEVTFHPMQGYIEAFIARAPKAPNATARGMANLRKATYSNGWDFAPKFPTCGIYRNVSLVAYDTARMTDVVIDQDLTNPGEAKLSIKTRLDGEANGLRARARVTLAGKPVASAEGELADLSLRIADPQLWWPNGMGAQPLYEVTVELLDAHGERVDQARRRIGLRKIELLAKTSDRPLRLAVNGREIFAKGVNWIPADMFSSRVTPERLRRFIADAAATNMNFIRTWGGGYYEEDAFYDACDEMGLMVWSEFKFACNAYPGGNPEFQENARAEVTDQVRRLRHHPSIAVWCGNNECEALVSGYKVITQAQYDALFHGVIGKRFTELFPATAGNFVGGSPEAGDEHNWWVWHIGANFEKYFESHGWMTEFGFQSFSNPDTTRSFTDPADRTSVNSDVMNAHQHNKNGNTLILDQMARYFRPAKDFDSTLWLSQINQGYGMTMGIEHWRTDWPRSSGSFVWQYNDCAPVASWSSVDYCGRWKAAQYLYRAAYAPLMVTGKVDPKTSDVSVAIASDLATAVQTTLTWALMDTAGKRIAGETIRVDVPAGTTAVNVPVLKLAGPVEKAGRRNALLWLSLEAGGKVVSTKLLTFRRPKDLSLVDPQIALDVVEAGDGFDVTVRAERPAMWAWLTCGDPDARYSDNFVHLQAGGSRQIHVTPSRPMGVEAFRAGLKVQSLYDTYDHAMATESHAVVTSANGTMTAMADSADINGTSARLEKGTPPNIGGWSDAGDSLEWTIPNVRPGTYRVMIEYACPAGDAGSSVSVAMGEQSVEGVVERTDGWTSYRKADLGVLRVETAGETVLSLRPLKMPHQHVMNFRSLTLEPVLAGSH